MEIRFTECMATDCGLFADLAKYDRVEKWFTALIHVEAEVKALDAGVKFKDKWHWLVIAGHAAPDAEAIIKRIARLPSWQRRIPNDTMLIRADAFERELFVNLDGA